MKKTLLTLLGCAILSFGSKAQVQGYTVGQTVDDFTITDTDGNTHTLSTYTDAGKWVLLDFFFTTCGPCQQTAPIFNEFYEKYGCNDGDIVCLSINTGQDNNAAVQAFETQHGGNTAHAPAISGDGNSGPVNSSFNPAGYPTYCLIDADRKLKLADIWPISSVATLESAVTGAGHTINEMNCATNSLTEEALGLNDVSLFPNPATDQAFVNANLDHASEVNVKVYNMVGALVSENVFNGVAGENKFDLNTSVLENGQYIVKVALGEKAQKQLNISIVR